MRRPVRAAVVAASLSVAAVPAARVHPCASKGTKRAIIRVARNRLKADQLCAKAMRSKHSRRGFRCEPRSDGRYGLRRA